MLCYISSVRACVGRSNFKPAVQVPHALTRLENRTAGLVLEGVPHHRTVTGFPGELNMIRFVDESSNLSTLPNFHGN